MKIAGRDVPIPCPGYCLLNHCCQAASHLATSAGTGSSWTMSAHGGPPGLTRSSALRASNSKSSLNTWPALLALFLAVRFVVVVGVAFPESTMQSRAFCSKGRLTFVTPMHRGGRSPVARDMITVRWTVSPRATGTPLSVAGLYSGAATVTLYDPDGKSGIDHLPEASAPVRVTPPCTETAVTLVTLLAIDAPVSSVTV